MSPLYRLTFDTRLRLTAEVHANDQPMAHFAAFCEAAGAIQNDGIIQRQLAALGITVDRLEPLALVRITAIDRRAAS